MSILENLKQFTYLECFECCSVHKMNYYDNEYECEECYRTESFDNIDKNEILINWKSLKNYILNHETPKKTIKIFTSKILNQNYNENQINDEFDNLINFNKLCGH